MRFTSIHLDRLLLDQETVENEIEAREEKLSVFRQVRRKLNLPRKNNMKFSIDRQRVSSLDSEKIN